MKLASEKVRQYTGVASESVLRPVIQLCRDDGGRRIRVLGKRHRHRGSEKTLLVRLGMSGYVCKKLAQGESVVKL